MFIYVHLPFCLSHCIYCDFYVELKGTPDRRGAYLKALHAEIRYALGRASQLSPIQTLYFGGGTPGLFTADEIREIIATLHEYVPFAPDAEITFEANPEGTASPIAEYKATGINRLSVGVQSLQPNELKRLSRVHSQDQVFRFLDDATKAGFDNISIDLMYGIPEQTLTSWKETLEKAVTLPVTHISMYGLQVEEDTRLAKLLQQGRMSIPEDERAVEMYFKALDFLEAHDFYAYEISNLSKPGRASQHNLNYWDNEEFWGFGVSAHGYINNVRYENAMNLSNYLKNPEKRSTEHLVSRDESLQNALIFGLRKREGVNILQLEKTYQFDFKKRFGKETQRFFDSGHLFFENNKLKLSKEAIPISNEILLSFITN